MPEVHVYLAAGRSVEQKRNLMREISDAVVKNTGAPIDSVTVQIIEAPLIDKMKGGVTFEDRRAK
jgi:4-oxalocrotonate tautomerase